MARFVVLLGFFGVLVGISAAQGGQGGAMGGGAGGRMGQMPEGEAATSTHILTPGDRGEWPINARDGETFIVTATSTVFDPALELVDSSDKVLASNDDVHPGNQDPYLVYRFQKGGSFKILVKGFKSAAGGQYTISMRRFVSTEIKVGARTAASLGRTGVQWLRFPASAGQTMVLNVRASTFAPNINVFSPLGEEKEIDPVIAQNDKGGKGTFRADDAGDYYLRVGRGTAQASYAATVAVAKTSAFTFGSTLTGQKLEPGGLDIWTFEAKKGDLVRVNAQAPGLGVNATLAALPPAVKPGDTAPAEEEDGNTSPLNLPTAPKANGVVVALIRKTGTYQISISPSLDSATEYSLGVTNGLRDWKAADASAELRVGDADYWSFEGTRGQILQLEGQAKQFDLFLDLISPSGDTIAMNDDGAGGTNPLMTTLLPDTGRYIVRAACFGNGGSGAYALKRSPSPIRALALGVKGEGSIGLGGTEIWSLQGHAGQTILVSARSQEFDTVLRIVGPDGVDVAANDDGGDGTDSLVSIKLPLDGTYTVWVTGKGSGKYAVRWLDLDK